MSKIISLVGANNATNVQVKQSTAMLCIEYSCLTADAATQAAVLTKMNNVLVDVDLQSKGLGTKNLLAKMPLGVLAEIYSSGDGVLDMSTVAATTLVRFSIEVGALGALDLNDQTTIVIETTGGEADTALDVFAVDYPVGSIAAVKCDKIRFSANAPQVVNAQSSTHLHLPVASTDNVEINYRGGKVVTLEKKEIESWLVKGLGIVSNFKTATTSGFINYYSIPITDAVSVKVTMTADVNGYMFNYVSAK